MQRWLEKVVAEEVHAAGWRSRRSIRRSSSNLLQCVVWLVALLISSGCAKREPDQKEAASRSASALVTGLVAAYGFEEGTGTTTADASGAGLTGTLTGTVWQRGKVGNALSFNGTADSVTIPDVAALHLTTGMTLSAWVRPTAPLVGQHPLVTKGTNWPSDYGLYARLDSGLPSALVLAGGQAGIAAGSSSLPVGVWTHLATTYDGSTLSFYVDGTLATTEPLAGPIDISTGPLRIGGNDIGARYFAGLIDEMRIYDRALSASELASDMASAIAPAGPTLPMILGDSSVLPSDDEGNGDLMEAQQASLAEPTAIQSLSLYVTNAVGQLRMGIYAADGPDGDPGILLAETDELTPAVGWNTANILSPVVLQPGAYWLVYLPSDNALGVRIAGVGTYVEFPFAFGPMPATYSTPSDRGPFHWSFYATGIPPVAAQCTQGGAPMPSGTACSDSNPCNGAETCDGAGNCVAGAPVVCTALDQCHVAGTCNPANGQCSNSVEPDGTTCNDGSGCTQTDSCQAGVCAGSNPVACVASDQCHDPGTCSPATGTCSNPQKANGASCNDGDACTQTDACQQGVCSGSNLVACAAPDQCHLPGSCSPATGACSNPQKPDGSVCSDSDACTTGDACQAGACSAGVTVASDDQNPCTADSCDPSQGVAHSPVPSGTSCADGDACNGAEICNGSGSCVAGTPPATDDGNPCTADACDPSTGSVSHIPVAAGTICQVADLCREPGVCNASGTCFPGAPATPDDGDPCTLEFCDSAIGFFQKQCPPLDKSAPTSAFEQSAWLYTGQNPVQKRRGIRDDRAAACSVDPRTSAHGSRHAAHDRRDRRARSPRIRLHADANER